MYLVLDNSDAFGTSVSGTSTVWQANYIGCFVDSSNRDLPIVLSEYFSTQASCNSLAAAGNYLYFGLQNGGECWAGNSYGSQGSSASGCTTVCYANTAQVCGGPWSNSVFSVAR